MKKRVLSNLALMLICSSVMADPLLQWVSDNATGGSGSIVDRNGQAVAAGSSWLVELVNADTDDVLFSTTAGFLTGGGRFIMTPDGSAWNNHKVKTRIYDAASSVEAQYSAEFNSVQTLSWDVDPAPPGVVMYNAGRVGVGDWQALSETSFASEADIGNPGLSGSTDFVNDVYTLEGGGADIWGTADQFYFASDPHSGDGELVVKVDSLEATHGWAKGGIMFRETISADSKFVMVAQRPDQQVCMQWRETSGGGASWSGSLVGGTGDAKWLKLTRDGDLYTGYYSSDGENWTLISQVAVSMDAAVQAGLCVTSHNNSLLCTAQFSEFSLVADPRGYFVNADDVGAPALTGTFMHVGNSYVMEGGGNDIWSTEDNFFFASQRRSGDAEIAARVVDVENCNTWSKGGIMFRETLDSNSKHVAIVVRPDRMISMQWREATGGACGHMLAGDTTNVKWVKLVRSAADFTGYYSIDGSNWIEITSTDVVMNDQLEVGLAVTSHDDAVLCTSTFTDVTIE